MEILIAGLVLLNVFNVATSTCVLESEFGFILNCNFRKSGLFRVRNLGGLKAHFGLGFSLGDELGFGESLGNLEGNRRRALNYKTDFVNKVGVVSPPIEISTTEMSRIYGQNARQNKSSMTEVQFLPLGVPTFRPIPTYKNNIIRRSDVVVNSASNTKNKLINGLYDWEENTSASNGLKNISRSYTVNKVSSNTVTEKTYNKNLSVKTDLVGSKSPKPAAIYDSGLKKKSSSSRNSVQSSKVMVVMNAPKEYYPTGYEKNFDDQFKAKVKLPQTDFTCTEQKYFPGLYANIELGCMVFHVCAITDNGIIMKSFLCPESTLFDQSILKCNWWFYVDCNNGTYDSNIPISKSYQLIKSLSDFSNITSVHMGDQEVNMGQVTK